MSGFIVSVGDTGPGGPGKIATSEDAVTWTQHDAAVPAGVVCRRVATNNDVIVVSTWGYGAPMLVSSDGITWTQHDSMFGSEPMYDIVWAQGLGLFIAGGSGRSISTSPDGRNWTARFIDFPNLNAAWPEQPVQYPEVRAICWAPELGLLVLGCDYGNIGTSPDGINWTVHPPIGAMYLLDGFETFGVWSVEDIAWSPQLGLFAMSANDMVVTSTNGITWTARTEPVSVQAARAAWSPDLGMFRVGPFYSRDGINWPTSFPTGGGSFWWSIWSSRLKAWISAGNPGAYDISTSVDGLLWTKVSTDIYSNDCALFRFEPVSIVVPPIVIVPTDLTGLLAGRRVRFQAK